MIADFLIAFGSPIDTNIMDLFGLGRGSPRWAWQPLKVLQFFKKAGDVQIWPIISCDLPGQFYKHTLAQIGQPDPEI